jgi:putative transposase
VHSETGQSPLDRFRQDTTPSVRPVDPLSLRTAFLFRDTRRVTKTGTINFQGNRYTAPAFLVGQTVELRYDPFDLSSLEIWFNNQFFTQAQPVHLQTSIQPGLTPDPVPSAPPPSTGLDYLAMLRQERERLLREQLPPIPFTRLTPPQEDDHV